jgi:hypothetical protein
MNTTSALIWEIADIKVLAGSAFTIVPQVSRRVKVIDKILIISDDFFQAPIS